MSTKVFDPTSEQLTSAVESPDRLASLQGATIGLLDISKPRGDVFLVTLESLLSGIGAITMRYIKPTFTKPAPVDLRHEIAAQCDAVIEALAD